MQPLTTKERSRLEELESQIKLHREQERSAVFEAGNALIEIRESKLYREDGTFEEYCKLRWNWSARHAYRVCEATEFRNGQLLLSETSDEEVQVPKTEREARKLKSANVTQCRNAENKTENFKQNLSKPVSAKLVPDAEIGYAKPPPMPTDIRMILANLSKQMDKALHRTDLPFELFQEVRMWLHGVEKAQQLLQQALPGFEDTIGKKFVPPKKEQCMAFAVEIGLQSSDGEEFFFKKQGRNWEGVKCWKSVMQSWKLQKHFDSQKTVNGYGKTVPKEKSLGLKIAEQTRREIERL